MGSGCLETVKALINNGDEINFEVKTTSSFTPLIIASIQGFYEIAELLIENGALLLYKKRKKKGPLIYAAKNGQIHIVSLLIRKGVHPEYSDSSGNSPLHYAAAFGWLNIVKYLIKWGANPNQMNDWGAKPLDLAIMKNNFGIYDYLLGLKSVDKEIIDNFGRTVRYFEINLIFKFL